MLKFLNALAALAAVGTFVIAFLDSYEVRFNLFFLFYSFQPAVSFLPPTKSA